MKFMKSVFQQTDLVKILMIHAIWGCYEMLVVQPVTLSTLEFFVVGTVNNCDNGHTHARQYALNIYNPL